MSNDEKTIGKQVDMLAKSIWQAWVAGPPRIEESDINTMKVAINLRIPLVRATLLTLALILSSKLGKSDLTSLHAALASTWTNLSRFHIWIAIFTLLVLSASAQRIEHTAKSAWLWLCRHKFFPVVVVLSSIWLISTSISPLSVEFWVSSVLFFATLTITFRKPDSADTPVTDDLQRGYLIDRLIDHMKDSRTRLRRIALVAEWGSGKTVILNLLRKKLCSSEYVRSYVTATVNPWQSQTSDEAMTIIAEGFEEALAATGTFTKKWRNHRFWSLINGFKTAAGQTITVDLTKLFDSNSAVIENELIHRINRRIAQSRKILVLLVDDMERADPEIVKKLFPIIDKLRQIEGCFFLFAIDPNRVARAFGEQDRGGSETKGYLDKVFDLQLSLPEPRNRDIRKLAKQMIDPTRTPKLHSAFDSIAEFLPENPRSAVHFINDASSKEVLFLNRHQESEHDYSSFFIMRILELELPGISQFLLSSNFINAINSIRSNRIWGSPRDHESESQAIQNALGQLPTNMTAISRHRAALVRLCVSNLDLRWGAHDHMRLINLSGNERSSFHDDWVSRYSRESLQDILHITIPGMNFTDELEACSELIEREISAYANARSDLASGPVASRDSLVGTAHSILNRLCRHLEFAQAETLTFDLDCFEPPLFNQWLGIIGRTEIQVLSADEVSFVRLLERRLDWGARYEFARWPTQTQIYMTFPEGVYHSFTGFLEELRTSMLTSIRDEVVHRLRSGDSLRNIVRTFGVGAMDMFSDPTNWLPNLETDGLSPLVEMRNPGGSSEITQLLFVEIASLILRGIRNVLTGGTADRAGLLLHNIQTYPSYFRCIWEVALGSPSPQTDLLHLRETCRSAWVSNYSIGNTTFDTAFPVSDAQPAP